MLSFPAYLAGCVNPLLENILAERLGGQSCKERLVSKVKSYQKTEDQEKSISFC